jgi:hypothetical protein
LSPGWAACRLGCCPSWASPPRLGRIARLRPGWAASCALPGWAGSGGSGLAGISPLGRIDFTRKGLSRPELHGPGQDSLISQLGHLLFTVPAGPGWDSLAQAGLLLSQAEIHHLRHISLVWHQLQRLVPVLGRLQARTGTSSTIVCWSWDASWLRPAYPSSPSQSYPQEEDKTDDMGILKTAARRRSQGLQGQTSMGQAHDHDAVHSTEDGTVLMQAIV